MLFLLDLDGTLIECNLTSESCDACGGSGAEQLHPWDPAVTPPCVSCNGRGVKNRQDPDRYDTITWLPRRETVLRALAVSEDAKFAVVTNQTDPYFGTISRARVDSKLLRVGNVLHDLVWPRRCAIFVCYAPGPDRKPLPGLLVRALRHFEALRQETVMVGDRDSDRQAAEAAGVAYCDAEAFFRNGARDAAIRRRLTSAA